MLAIAGQAGKPLGLFPKEGLSPMLPRSFFAALALACAAPVAAQDGEARTVSAAQPSDLVLALLNAGYDPELTEDGIGDPLILFRRADGYPLQVVFYDCDEETHDDCGAIQLRAGLDRAEPWNAADAMEIARRLRFAAVTLDEEGDPWLEWDILTRGGIPEALFVEAAERFELTVEQAAQMVFAEEVEAEAAEATEPGTA